MKQTVAALTLIALGLTAGIAYSSNHQPNRIAFLARADNPVDALAASSVAAQYGGIVLLTPQDRLGDDARQGLANYRPDLVIIAGGPQALSPQVEEDTRQAGYDTRRVAGTNRTDTATQTANLLNEYRTHLRAMLSGAIFMYPSQIECPDGMVRYTPLDGAFPRGGTTNQAGGSNLHTHPFATDSGNARESFGSFPDVPYDEHESQESGPWSHHDHHVEGETSPASSLPPYVNVRYCQMP